MVLLSIFFTNQITEGSSLELFFIHFVAPHALALHLAVEILLQIACMKI